jgi:hypothetical protein
MPVQSVTFEESTTRTRSKVATIQNLKNVLNVTVDTGNVSFTVNGNDVTVNVSNGAYTRYTTTSYTPSRVQTDYRTSSIDSFVSSISYNSGGYSGTLNKNGSSYVTSGSYTPAQSKTGYAYGGQTGCADWIWTSSGWSSGGTYFPSPGSVSYNQDGYSGTLSNTRVMPGAYGSAKPSYNGTSFGQTATTCTGYREIEYSGTVTKPSSDTRVWRQDYSGTVYGATEFTNTYYYEYTANVEYEEFQPPTPPVLTFPLGGETITTAKQITWGAGTDVETPVVDLKYEIDISVDGGATYEAVTLTNAGVTSFLYDFLSKPDTTQGKIRMRTFDGSMYSPYVYSELFTIQHNIPPVISLTANGQPILNDGSLLISDGEDVTLSITPDDVDSTNLQYKIDFRGVNKVPFTSIGNDQTVNYMLNNEEIAVGINVLTVTVKDNLVETVFTMTIRNKTPQTLSLRDVLNVEHSLGYTNTSYSNLRALVPEGYSGKLSLSEILNFLI